MSADSVGTPLRAIDEQVEESARLAAALLALSAGAQSPALSSLYSHARAVMVACQGWPPTRSQIEQALSPFLPLPESARATLPSATPVQVAAFAAALAQSREQLQGALRGVHAFNTQLGDPVAALTGDATAVAAELQSDDQRLGQLRAHMEQINADYEPTAGHVLTWIGKGVVSAGIWPAVEAESDREKFNSLGRQFDATRQEAEALQQAEGPLGGLLASLQRLEGDLLNVAAGAEEADNIMQSALRTRQDLPDPSDVFYQATLQELGGHLERLSDQARAILQG